MKTRLIAVGMALLCACGCRSPNADNAQLSDTELGPAATPPRQQPCREIELRVDRARAERLGFTFSRMADYFSTLKMPKHEYGTKYVGETFVIGMRGTPENLKRIAESTLTTDHGHAVKAKDLCTVHIVAK